jgi:hypothetical protein
MAEFRQCFLFRYKNGKEFYRYMPGQDRQTTIFDVPGVNIDVSLVTLSTFKANSISFLITDYGQFYRIFCYCITVPVHIIQLLMQFR